MDNEKKEGTSMNTEIDRLMMLATEYAQRVAEPFVQKTGPLTVGESLLAIPEWDKARLALQGALEALVAAHPLSEQVLRQILAVVQRYLPPDGIDAQQAIGEIIKLIDPWPPVAERQMTTAKALVLAQAEDDGLWFIAERASEAYLQHALRALHAAVESDARVLSAPLAALETAPLTDDDISNIGVEVFGMDLYAGTDRHRFARAIEAHIRGER